MVLPAQPSCRAHYAVCYVSDWSQGLVYGLGVSGPTNETELPADCQEYLTDVLQISQVDDIELQPSDDDDNNYEELVEYLRMGLFLLYGELNPTTPEDKIIEH